MLEKMKRQWATLKQDEPGQRFQQYYQRRHQGGSSPAKRILLLTAGTLALIAGLILLVIPGPGIPVVVIGAAILAGESAKAAQALDATEVAGRKFWEKFRPGK